MRYRLKWTERCTLKRRAASGLGVAAVDGDRAKLHGFFCRLWLPPVKSNLATRSADAARIYRLSFETLGTDVGLLGRMAGGNDRSSVPDKGMGKLNLNAVEFRLPARVRARARSSRKGQRRGPRPPPAKVMGAIGTPARTAAGASGGGRARGEGRRIDAADPAGVEARARLRARFPGPKAPPRPTDAFASASGSNGAPPYTRTPAPGLARPPRRARRLPPQLHLPPPREPRGGQHRTRPRDAGGAPAPPTATVATEAPPTPSLDAPAVERVPAPAFLQANFRFLVADWADLTGAASDPDRDRHSRRRPGRDGRDAALSCPGRLDEPMMCAQVTPRTRVLLPVHRASRGAGGGRRLASRRSARCASRNRHYWPEPRTASRDGDARSHRGPKVYSPAGGWKTTTATLGKPAAARVRARLRTLV